MNFGKQGQAWFTYRLRPCCSQHLWYHGGLPTRCTSEQPYACSWVGWQSWNEL